jgi:hypothetical protein
MTTNRTSSTGRTARRGGRAAADRRADAAAKVATPEQVVVTSPIGLARRRDYQLAA